MWRVRHVETGAERALKTIRDLDAEAALRFRREGEALARVDDHPHIVRVHSAGQAGPWPYLVMDLCDGGDLAERLRAGPLEPDEAARVVRDVARGLAHAHARGVLHRDLKPQNVLFDGPGGERPRLVDFGLCRIAGERSLTRTGDVLGTPGSMAPEQARGEPTDERTDVWGLGALLFHALVGRPPFSGRTPLEVLQRVLTADIPDPAALRPDVPVALSEVCLRAMTRDAAARFPSASAFADALDAAASRPDGAARGRVPPRAVVLLALFASTTLVVFVALAALGALARARERSRAEALEAARAWSAAHLAPEPGSPGSWTLGLGPGPPPDLAATRATRADLERARAGLTGADAAEADLRLADLDAALRLLDPAASRPSRPRAGWAGLVADARAHARDGRVDDALAALGPLGRTDRADLVPRLRRRVLIDALTVAPTGAARLEAVTRAVADAPRDPALADEAAPLLVEAWAAIAQGALGSPEVEPPRRALAAAAAALEALAPQAIAPAHSATIAALESAAPAWSAAFERATAPTAGLTAAGALLERLAAVTAALPARPFVPVGPRAHAALAQALERLIDLATAHERRGQPDGEAPVLAFELRRFSDVDPVHVPRFAGWVDDRITVSSRSGRREPELTLAALRCASELVVLEHVIGALQEPGQRLTRGHPRSRLAWYLESRRVGPRTPEDQERRLAAARRAVDPGGLPDLPVRLQLQAWRSRGELLEIALERLPRPGRHVEAAALAGELLEAVQEVLSRCRALGLQSILRRAALFEAHARSRLGAPERALSLSDAVVVELAELEAAATDRGRQLELRVARSQAHRDRAEIIANLFGQARAADSVAEAKRALELAPGDEEAHSARGTLAFLLARWERLAEARAVLDAGLPEGLSHPIFVAALLDYARRADPDWGRARWLEARRYERVRSASEVQEAVRALGE